MSLETASFIEIAVNDMLNFKLKKAAVYKVNEIRFVKLSLSKFILIMN